MNAQERPSTGISLASATRFWLAAGAINGFIAVAAGAFGAHALKDLPERYLDVFNIGARYEMCHALAMLAVAFLPRTRLATTAGWGFLAGIIIFSGSLYALALTRMNWLGAITPIGGVLMLVGWLCLAAFALARK